MISVDEALAMVLQHARPLPPQRMTLAAAHGYVLAEDIASDIDSPPHDKAMVDGYAVTLSDLESGTAELEIVDEVMAGDVPHRPLQRGQATRIMTGAPVPDGAEAVVMVERTRHIPGGGETLGRVEIHDTKVPSGRNILVRGTVMRRGDAVLHKGAELRPIEIGLLAEVGRAEVLAIPQPRVAILSTGNEVVPADQSPGPGQIRNSNGPLLAASVRRRGAEPLELGIARDEHEMLTERIRRGLEEADIVVLSGGVSAGVLDLVPQVLAALGVEQVFHKVRLKPGKPVWFGRLPAETGNKLVFGLPGNPVSSLVCFELFVRPAIAALAGRTSVTPTPCRATLAAVHRHRGDRPTYHPSVLEVVEENPVVRPLGWRGSADLRTLAAANALAHFPAGDREYAPGEAVEVIPLD